MATVTDLVFEEEFGHLCQVAENRGWDLTQIDGPGFILVLPARDESYFALRVICDDYRSLPPILRWHNTKTHASNQLSDTPKGSGGYFHGSGRICAPWNRIAYKQEDPKGPHGNWQLSNWITNPRTGECTTLTAMAVRMAVELISDRYKGRNG